MSTHVMEKQTGRRAATLSPDEAAMAEQVRIEQIAHVYWDLGFDDEFPSMAWSDLHEPEREVLRARVRLVLQAAEKVERQTANS